MASGKMSCSSRTQRYMKATALVASLVLSANLLAATVGRPSPLAWVAWITPLPVFWAIRHCRPIVAASCGALWGLSFCLLSAGAAQAGLSTSMSLLLLCAVPAIYAGLGSLMTRAIGFNPLMLACGWILLELALKPAGLHHGLLAAAALDSDELAGGPLAGGQLANDPLAGDPVAGGLSEGGAAHWLARLLGYVLLASLLAGGSASLLGIVTGARISFPARRSLAGSPNVVGHLPSQVVLAIQSWTLRQAHPRAPPIRVPALS